MVARPWHQLAGRQDDHLGPRRGVADRRGVGRSLVVAQLLVTRAASWTSTNSSPQFGLPDALFGSTRPRDVADERRARGCNQKKIRQLADIGATKQQRYG